MGLALEKSSRIYYLHVRCANCVRDSQMSVFVPAGCEPIEANEWADCAELSSLRYQCEWCDSAIGQIVGVVAGS